MNLDHGGNLFAIARNKGWDWHDIADFSASINPLGPSPAVMPAIQLALDRIVHYPECEPRELQEALAQQWNVAPENILLGNGATELIHFVSRVKGFSQVTLVPPVFTEFHRAFPDARVGQPSTVEDLVVLTQPLNPTGQFVPLERYLDAPGALLIDESFLDFTGQPSSVQFIDKRPGLYVLRSLTKFYALPGLRAGALVASADLIEDLRRKREPWQVNTLAERAALAALADRDHAIRSIEFIRAERQWMSDRIAEIPGATPQPSCANYMLVALDHPAAALVSHLLERKILVRDCSGWPGVTYASAIRVAVRTRPENQRLLAAWKEFACDC
jgi:threonine-phosphate decarboxylase